MPLWPKSHEDNINCHSLISGTPLIKTNTKDMAYPSARQYLESALVDERPEVGLPRLVRRLEPHGEERHLRPHERHVFVLGLK